MSDDSAVPDGIKARPVERWLGERVAVSPPLRFEKIAGGRSNLTFRVSDDLGQRWVLRRPPLHSVLASAHDVGREHRIMKALRDTAVPVPPVVGFEPDDALIGAPFCVMEFVEGVVPRDSKSVVETLNASARTAMAFELADRLADLHAVDPSAVGLAGLGRPRGYIARQLRRWSGQHEAGSGQTAPLVREVHDLLAARIPDQGPARIVHGDYRLDNTIIGEDGRIKALLDWELSTLGDPLADLGLLQVYWTPPAGRELPMIPPAGLIPGVPPIDEVLERYARRAEADLSELGFYVAFGYWKLAIILEGVAARQVSGAYGSTDGSHREFRSASRELLAAARSRAASLG